VQVYMKADVVMVAWIAGSAASGEYGPAATLINALFVIPAVLYAVLLPVFSRLAAQNNPNGLRGAVSAALGVCGILGVGLFAGVAGLADPIVRGIYGAGFQSATPLLVVLSILLVFKCPSFALAAWLVATDRQNRRVVVQATAAGLNLGLNLLLIPTCGAMGAAWAYVASEAALCLGYALAGSRGIAGSAPAGRKV
jgi:O-antigen/teichoic acid export membrane protein